MKTKKLHTKATPWFLVAYLTVPYILHHYKTIFKTKYCWYLFYCIWNFIYLRKNSSSMSSISIQWNTPFLPSIRSKVLSNKFSPKLDVIILQYNKKKLKKTSPIYLTLRMCFWLCDFYLRPMLLLIHIMCESSCTHSRFINRFCRLWSHCYILLLELRLKWRSLLRDAF